MPRLTTRITEILTTHQDVDLGVEGERSWLAAFLAAAAEEHYRPVIKSSEHLMELLDKHGHEIVVLDAHNGAWQTYYDVDDGVYPGILLWSPGAGA